MINLVAGHRNTMQNLTIAIFNLIVLQAPLWKKHIAILATKKPPNNVACAKPLPAIVAPTTLAKTILLI